MYHGANLFLSTSLPRGPFQVLDCWAGVTAVGLDHVRVHLQYTINKYSWFLPPSIVECHL